MIRSISEPSLSTVGTGTMATNVPSRLNLPQIGHRTDGYRGKFLWEGRMRKITLAVMSLPWNMWFQTLVCLTILFKFVVHLLLGYYLNNSYPILAAMVILTETFFICDVLVHCLHALWPPVRMHVRIYRRSYVLLIYDVLTFVPLISIFNNKAGYEHYLLFGRWLKISRIYRLFTFFQQINGTIRDTRKTLYVIEHITVVLLVLHASTCLLFAMHRSPGWSKNWYQLGYPDHVNSHKLKYDTYISCWYYTACRFFNVIFGDTFPLRDLDKWLSSILMLIGFVFMRYHFIGTLAWELVRDSSRKSEFIDQYHHMISYLKFRGAPTWLIEQARNYKRQLWIMKDGILSSKHLQKLPLPLQMELIFDINVGHFKKSLIFKDTDEAFLRQISLLMRHEIYLAGQRIWTQDVVKTGMICIKQGVIEMLSDEDDESPMIAFKEGTVLGELSLFYSIPSKVTVKAATYVELQVLRRTDFMRVAEEQPFMLQRIRKIIEDRLWKSRRKEEAIAQYDKGDSRLIRTRYRPMKVLKDNLAGVEEEDPTFVDDSHMYYRDENNVRQPKFTSEYLKLYQISNNVTTIDKPKICIRANFPWILEPNTSFTNMFDVGHFIMILYLCFLSPHYAIQTDRSDLQTVFSTIVISGLLFNIYIQLTTAIVDKNIRKETIKEIAEVKMATVGFYLDILSVFPMYIFTDTLDPRGESVAGQVVKLFPTLQVWHIWDYISKWEKNFNSNAKLLCLLKYCLIFIILCYWSGCFLYLFACPKKLCHEKSWMAQLIFWETKVFMINEARHEKPFLTSSSFGTSVFTGTGTSDLAPGRADLFVVMLIFALGTYLFCFYTAKICSIYLLATRRKLKFKESMRELFYFLTVNRVSAKIKARVRKFFSVQWYYNNAILAEEIFKDMSSNIQQEVLCIEMVETLLFCPIFQGCNRDFLQTVASNSRTIVLPDNEVVQHAGDIGRDMYILQKGHSNLLNHRGKIDKTIGPGSHFGVVEMLFGLPKVYTVVTTTNCILLHVEYSALVQCWGTFPDISHPIITVLEDPVLRKGAKRYEDAKPLTGRLDAKINRIAQEIKESFVVLSGREEKAQYVKTFEKLGVMRYTRYMFLPGCITPHGIFLKFWCTVRFIMSAFYIVTIPYNMATKQNKYGGEYSWADIILYIDIVIMAYVAYYNEHSLLVTHPLLTVSRYLKHAFFLDAISVFPIEQLVKIINDNTDVDLYRMNRMLLVTRIIGTFSYWESDIMRLNPMVVLLKFLPFAITVVNIATSIIFTYSCVPFLRADSNYIIVNCSRVLIVSSNRYEVKYAVTEYAQTFFWVFEMFVGCGCTPVGVQNTVDVWLTMILQVTGFLYFAFMFGYVSSTRSADAHALLEHNEKTRDLANFLYQENVDPILTARTLKYFEYVWKRTNGSNAQQICRCLNSALMEDTLVFMYEKALREVPLFGKVERSFIRVITQHLHEMYFLKGESVIQVSDIQPYIYIIYRGKVDVLTSYNEMITCMGPGGMFGNFSGQPVSCSAVSIYASRSLDLLVIPGQTFFNLIKYYPKVQEPLNKAFSMSKDYILPITMDIIDESSSDDSEVDLLSLESAIDSRSGSSRFDISGHMSIRSSQSQSNMSQAKSSISIMTYQSYVDFSNLLRPGTWLFQSFGYITCLMATCNYVLGLYELVTLNDCFILFWIHTIFDLFFYLKIYLNMHQGFINKHGDLIMAPGKCRRRYYKHKLWIWSDILVNLPLELFGFCSPYPLTAMHYLRANKLLRLKYLVDFYRKTAYEITNNLTILQAAMTIIIVILLIHSFSCIFLIVMIATSPTSVIRPLKLHLIDEETPQKRWDYTTSFYLVLSELTTTGGDEFIIEEIFPMIILGICLVAGKMLAAVVVATSIQIAYSTNYALNCYEKVTHELIDMLKNQGLSNYQLKKFWKYVRQLWVTERGRQLPVLLEQMPYVRRCDLMSAMFGHHLRNCYLFADTGESFLRQLSAALDYNIFFPGNYILLAGDNEARMYWVASGTVSVVSVRPDLTETTHEYLNTGDVFGILQGMNRGISHCFSYRAETKTSILTLSLDSWINILPFFPDAKRIITERSEVLFA
ncbi:uncharacterized protein LOC113513411 [Galleria mellonella]|uniref:Uncharacterized protein LOC113513411 n=1 Tax=Galleria mellonella TaxID=7137 RepID=A0ABM3N7E6_GALME|nr:uncharacterized protein LOC113513411 [Galleria mellonella]